MTTVGIEKCRRPALRYHGGKWKLAPWLLTFFPEHRIYVEPFAGAASVLLRKKRSFGEVYNDLDDEVVNVFRVLQDRAKADELARLLWLTSYSRTEFRAAYAPPAGDVDRALKMIVRSFMGFGSASMTRCHHTGFRSNTKRSGTIPAGDWANYPEEIHHFTARLRGVVIENRPAAAVMKQHDTNGTLHYVDPPYPFSTRSSARNRNGNTGHYYRHDMTDNDHRDLAGAIHGLDGMVIISGYPCDLYDQEIYRGWARFQCRHMADGARPRMEVIWLNEACASALERDRDDDQTSLFGPDRSLVMPNSFGPGSHLWDAWFPEHGEISGRSTPLTFGGHASPSPPHPFNHKSFQASTGVTLGSFPGPPAYCQAAEQKKIMPSLFDTLQEDV